jgi:hypothetical protein
MADARNPTFTPAHKVVIDALGFLISERIQHHNRALIIEAMDQALPHAHSSGNQILDRVILAAVEVSHAERLARQLDPEASKARLGAMLTASAAMGEYHFWRASLSIEAFRTSLATDGEAA